MYETRTFQIGEIRAAADNPRRLTGTAVVYGQLANISGKYQERITAGAFTRSLTSRPVKARFEHRDLLATTKNATLRLTDTPTGLMFEMDVAETRAGDDVLALVTRGDITGMSFGFLPTAAGVKWTYEKGLLTRDLTDLDLYEITVTDSPAYSATSVSTRSVDQATMDEAERLIASHQLLVRRMKLRRLQAA